jgi:hypothetical protein
MWDMADSFFYRLQGVGSNGEMVVIRNSESQLIIAKAEIVAMRWQRPDFLQRLSQTQGLRV